MRKLTQEEKGRKALFAHSRCNGCIYANCAYRGDMTDSKETDVKVWFHCDVNLTDLNEPLFFTAKCPRRYDTKNAST